MKAIKPNRKYAAWLIAMLPLLFSACNMKSASEEEKAASPTKVRTQTIEQVVHQNDLGFSGVVQPWEEAHIGSGVPARIEKIFVDVGDYVNKGDLLVQMDRTQIFQAKIQKQTLEADLKRLDTLLQMGAVTQQNYDQLKAQYDIAVSTVENLSPNTEIRATIPGVITGRYNSDGEIFSMTPGPAGKPAIVSIMQINPVKITVGVSEQYLTQVKKGQQADITTEAFPGRIFNGRVGRIHPTIDRMSGTFKVEITIDNNDRSLRPGMFTRVDLNLGETSGLLVPALAVLKQTGSNERYVFVIENGKAIRKSVQPGRNYDDKIEIVKGLQEGEQLVTSGQHNLMHLAEVEIVK